VICALWNVVFKKFYQHKAVFERENKPCCGYVDTQLEISLLNIPYRLCVKIPNHRSSMTMRLQEKCCGPNDTGIPHNRIDLHVAENSHICINKYGLIK